MSQPFRPQLQELTDRLNTRGRVVVATYEDYAGAQKAVDYLSDQGFPVERSAIVGEGLRIVEQVTGRLNATRALGLGLMQGVFTGLFIALILNLLGFGGERGFLSLMLDGLLLGGIFGGLWGLLGYALSGGRRDFTSVGGMRADHYSVMVDHEVAERATGLLSGLK
jgi:hypothetical protein